MDQEIGAGRHLSQISTVWSDLGLAHGGDGASAGVARLRILERYGQAIRSYLLAALRDEEAADEAYQDFALKLVRGDFRRVEPGRGRFRDFLKTTIYHLIVDIQRGRKRRPLALGEDLPEPAAEPEGDPEEDRRFLAIWRSEIIERAWEALEAFERQTGQPLHSVLRLRADSPEMKAPEMARVLADRLGRAVSPEWVHKRLFLARRKYVRLIVLDVKRSLVDPTPEAVEQELLELELLDLCRPAME